MSLKDEIQTRVREHRNRLEREDARRAKDARDTLAKSRRRIEEIRPMLDELGDSVDDGSIRVEYRENFASSSDVTVIVCVGEVYIREDADSSEAGFGAGAWFSFWPCFAEDGQASWSFFDGPAKHQWFDSVSDLLAHVIERVVEEVAHQRHARGKSGLK